MEFNDETIIISAGIIFYRINNNNIDVLLGKKVKANPELSKWAILGGRKEYSDSSFYTTAIREFNEETAGIFKEMIEEVDMYEILERSVGIRVNRMKYMIFMVSIDEENLHKYMTQVYDRFLIAVEKPLPKCMKEMCEIDWMSYTTLFDSEKITPFMRNRVARSIEVIRFFDNMRKTVSEI